MPLIRFSVGLLDPLITYEPLPLLVTLNAMGDGVVVVVGEYLLPFGKLNDPHGVEGEYAMILICCATTPS
jgi:hypothetical protein